MSITTVGSQLIHYEVLGRGRPLIFIHGWVGSWRYWWPSMQAMSSRHRSFAFDLWGFGDSSKATEKYTLNAYVEMIDQFISQLGISKPVDIVGHSLGAAVGLAYTIQHPDSVRRLAAISMPVQGAYIDSRLANTDPETFVNKHMGKANNFSEISAEVRKTDPAAMNQLATELARYNFMNEIANCPCPFLMVNGAQDSVIQPPQSEKQYLESMGGNRSIVELEESDYFPMLQEKAKFNRLLLDFTSAPDDSQGQIAPKEYWQRRVR